LTTIKIFLESKDEDIFFHEQSSMDFTKLEMDASFQEYQDKGFVTIKEYHENLTNFLNEFDKTPSGVKRK